MGEELCFNIENKNLYLEQVLVDYNDIPIFFLCKDNKHYYIVLCTNTDEMHYVVTKASLYDVYNLLHGYIPMRDVILKQREYWDVITGDEICLDEVVKKNMDEIKMDLLPDENAYFKILTNQIKLYVDKFDCELLEDSFIHISDKNIDLNELVIDNSTNFLLNKIDQYVELVDFKMQSVDFANVPLYNEAMQSIKKEDIVFGSYKHSKHVYEVDNARSRDFSSAA